MDGILQDFSAQVKQGLKAVINHLTYYLELNRQDRSADREFFEGMLHTLYSLKAGAGFLGEDSVQHFFRTIEKTVKLLQDGSLDISEERLGKLLDLLRKLSSGWKQEELRDLDLGDYVQQWKTIVSDDISDDLGGTVFVTGDIVDRFNFNISAYNIDRRIGKGDLYVVKINAVDELQEQSRSIMTFIAELARYGEIVDSNIDMEKVGESSLEMGFLFVAYHPLDIILSEIECLSADDFIGIDVQNTESSGVRFSESGSGAVETESDASSAQNDAKQESPPRNSSKNSNDSTSGTVRKTGKAVQKKAQPKILREDEQKNRFSEYREFVTFNLDDELYAVPIQMVHDIKALSEFSRLPNQPSHVLGVINLRGNVVPLYDMRRLLRVKERHLDETSVMVILKVRIDGREKIRGCLVDGISDVVTLQQQDKQITPYLSRNINREFVQFIGKDKASSAFLIVLDVERMLRDSGGGHDDTG